MENIKNTGIIIYESTFKICKDLPDNKGDELLKAICNKMFYDIEPEFKDIWLQSIYDQQILIISKAKQRYNASVENGKKGGAPKSNKNACKNVISNECNYSF